MATPVAAKDFLADPEWIEVKRRTAAQGQPLRRMAVCADALLAGIRAETRAANNGAQCLSEFLRPQLAAPLPAQPCRQR